MTPEDLVAAETAKRAANFAARLKAEDTWKNFLESTPPNVAVKIENLFGRHHPHSQSNPWSIPSQEIEIFCQTDDGPRIFASDKGHLFHDWEFLQYTCKNCGVQSKTFALLVRQRDKNSADAEVMKLGEFPPFGAPVSSRIGKLLGEQDLELYRKGMRSEAQGLGIGAATYFRRIVDNQWQLLVKELREAALKLGVKDVSVYDAALKETQFSTAVRMLKDAIPGKLLILSGENPLTLLHQPLSVQLHGLTDEQCLQQAADIRLVLVAMLENLADVLKDQNELRDAANRLKQVRS